MSNVITCPHCGAPAVFTDRNIICSKSCRPASLSDSHDRGLAPPELPEEIHETTCPNCNSRQVAPGGIHYPDGKMTPGSQFRPDGLKFFTLRSTCVSTTTKFHACKSCGLLWSTVNPEELKSLIARLGS